MGNGPQPGGGFCGKCVHKDRISAPDPQKGDDRGDNAQQHALYNKGDPDKAVGSAHILHNADFLAAGKDRRPDGVGDNHQGHQHQGCDDDAADGVDHGPDADQGFGQVSGGFRRIHVVHPPDGGQNGVHLFRVHDLGREFGGQNLRRFILHAVQKVGVLPQAFLIFREALLGGNVDHFIQPLHGI